MLHWIWCSLFLIQEKNPVSMHAYLISCIDLYVCIRICNILDILITVVLPVILSQTLFEKKLEFNYCAQK